MHEIYEAYRRALRAHSRVEKKLNSRKTRVGPWQARSRLGCQCCRGTLTAIWVGNWALPPQQQGLTVLRTLFGSDAYVRLRLAQEREEHDRLLQRIPPVRDLWDLQAAWRLLRYCAAPRANCLARPRPDSLPRHALGPCGCTASPVGASGALAPTLRWLGFALGLREAAAYRHALTGLLDGQPPRHPGALAFGRLGGPLLM